MLRAGFDPQSPNLSLERAQNVALNQARLLWQRGGVVMAACVRYGDARCAGSVSVSPPSALYTATRFKACVSAVCASVRSAV